MDAANITSVTEFLLLSLSDLPEMQTPLFILFLLIYLVGLLGNCTIMSAIFADLQLHTPMYFFIANLSLVDLCLTTVTVPKLLINIISDSKAISFVNCILQLFFFVSFVSIQSLLLGVMAYDRYVAICNPMHYFTVISRKACILFAALCWLIGLLNATLHSSSISLLSFCRENHIQSFFCDLPPVLKLSCSDTSTNELMMSVEGSTIVLTSIISIVVSYVRIISTILKIRSKEGRSKAFSTCSSHLIVVSLYYGAIFFTYVRPSSNYSPEKNNIVTVIYTVITPMINPFIYSLRNKQMKAALRKACVRHLLN